MQIIVVPGHNPGPFTGAGTNTYLITGRVPTLIDTASGDPAHLAALEQALASMPDGSQNGRSLSRVLVTHGHPDHAGGAAAIAGRWPDAVLAKMPWPGRDERYGVRWNSLADDERVAAGDGSLRVLHTPGHAPDHVCFLDEESGTVFAGDLVATEGTIVIPASAGGSLSQYLDSLHRILAIKPRRILPGHGASIDDPAALIEYYLRHRQEREQQILDALEEAPLTLPEIVARVYESLDSRLREAAGDSVLAHLLKLESEGTVSRQAETWARGSGPRA